MSPLDALAKHVATRNSSGLPEVMFQRNPPSLRDGFFREDEVWGFKYKDHWKGDLR
jgi:hypothetical protein